MVREHLLVRDLYDDIAAHSGFAQNTSSASWPISSRGVKEFRTIHAVPLEIVADGEYFDLRSLMVLIFNGETAGGFRLARTSSIRDGLFDCILLEKKDLSVRRWPWAVTCWAAVRRSCVTSGRGGSTSSRRSTNRRMSTVSREPNFRCISSAWRADFA